MKAAWTAMAMVLWAGGMLWAGEAAKDRPGRPEPTPEQKQERIRHLERQVQQMEAQLAELDKMAADLKSSEAQAQAKELKDTLTAAIQEHKSAIQAIQAGQRPAPPGLEKRADWRRQWRLVELYAKKEKAQAEVAKAADTSAAATAGKIVQVCDKLIANIQQIVKLEAEQKQLNAELAQLEGGPAKPPRGPKADRPRRAKADRPAETPAAP